MNVERKISIRQVMMMFFFTTVAEITRVLTPESGKFISKSSWISPLIAVLPVLLLIIILNQIIKKHEEKSLSQIIEIVFGKIIGKFFLLLFFIHALFFASFFLRNFGEKFISSIFPNVSPLFFIIILLLFVLFAVRRNIEYFARFAEFSFIIISIIFAIAFFVILLNIKPQNIYPVTYYDSIDILKSSIPVISLWSLLTFSLFFGDNINYTGKFKRTATKFMLITALFNILAMISIIGIFNAETAKNLPMPFFMIFKSIKSTGLIQSFETFFIILWAFTDFIMITHFMFIMSKIFKTLFSTKEKTANFFMIPVAIIIFILAYFIGENIIDAEYFYTNILSYSSIILGYVLPFLLLIVGKMRRVL